MRIGKRIRSLRHEAGMSQKTLGDLLGVTKATVQKYESGSIINLKQTTINKLCEIFNVSPIFLYGWDDESNLKRIQDELASIQDKLSNNQDD